MVEPRTAARPAAAAVGHAWRELRHHPGRYGAILLAVLVSVTFLAGSQIMLATESNALAHRAVLYASKADVVVDSYAWSGDPVAMTRDGAIAAAESALKADPDVAVIARFSRVRSELVNGDTVAGVMMTSTIDDPALRWFAPVEGRLPEAQTDVMLTEETAGLLGVRVGDTVKLNAQGAQPLTVVGLTRERGYGAPPAYVPISVLDTVARSLPAPDPRAIIVPKEAAKTTPGSSGGTLGVQLLVKAKNPAATQSIVDGVTAKVYDAGYLKINAEAKTADAVRKQAVVDAGQDDSWTPLLVTVAAGVALLVGALIISNTLNILLAQRRRQLGLLRAVGATRRQVLERTLAEAVLLGAAGSLLAVPLALLVAAVVAGTVTSSLAFGLVVPWGSVALAVLLGFAVTIVAAVGPVLRITRVSPLEALQPNPPTTQAARAAQTRAWLCGLAGVAGLGLLVWALVASGPIESRITGALWGGLLLGAGGLLATPLYVPPLMRLVATPLTGRGPLARVAIGNATRNPGRVGAAASALLVAVGLIVFVQVATAGARASAFAALDQRYPVDIALQSAVNGPDLMDPNGSGPQTYRDGNGRLIGFAPGALDAVLRTPGVAGAVMVPTSDTMVVTTGLNTFGLYPVAPLTPEAASQLRTPLTLQPGQIGVPADVMAELRASEGTVISLSPMTGQAAMLTAVEANVGPNVLVAAPETFNKMVTPTKEGLLLVTLQHPDDGDSVAAALTTELLSANPGLDTSGSAEQKAALRSLLADLAAVLTALLGVAALVALIGVGNTLSLSVIERTRENGLLRALGVTRTGVRRMLLLEAVLLSVITIVLGALAGIALGWAGARLLTELLGLPHPPPALDAVPLLATAAVVLAAGALASVLPGRRAASASPVEALADVG